jgi:hypothetical protein
LAAVASYQPQPWYNFTSGSDNAIDDSISSALKAVFLKIAALDKTAISSNNPLQANFVYAQIAQILKDVPYGGVYFNLIDHANKKYSYNFHYGSDLRVSSSSTFPAAGQRMLFQQTQLSNAILRNSNTDLNGAQITMGLRILPQVTSSRIKLEFGSIIGGILYPFGISFLLPIFTIVLVQEKEYRISIMMRMNGMKTAVYYLSHYVIMLILYTISTLIFCGTGVWQKLTLFTQTDSGALFLSFFLWYSLISNF